MEKEIWLPIIGYESLYEVSNYGHVRSFGFETSAGNKVSEDKTCGVGVYCKCGNIIYCCTDESYKKRGGKKEVDAYFKKGYRVGGISASDVQKLFGCNCKK